MSDRGIAIIGMAARFPGAPDLDAFRRNIEAGVDATSEAPPDRWDPVFYDPSSRSPDRLYCRRGGFLASPVAFDAAAFGIMPIAAEGADPDQLLALETAARALADAGYDGRDFSRERAGVVLGRGGYLTAGMARLEQRVRAAEQLARSLRALVPGIEEAAVAAVKAEFQAQLGPFGGDTAIGVVPNLCASRIANRLDLRGAAYTVDGACASSLLAVDQACRELDAGRADLMLAGGVHLCHEPTFWSVFCQLGALSPSGTLRPFDRRADGLLIGEGVGVVVLRRLADAERDGDPIYAVIRGTGVSSDGRGATLLTPAVEGQVLALTRAWAAAGLDPTTVGLVEAHGTATPAGDAAELATLARVFGPAAPGAKRAALGSVKSMIGHAMPAAGIAGLIKAALAIHHRVLPPTLHCEEPRPELSATRFRLPTSSEPWASDVAPRRAGVNAFGFGGINAHVVLEEPRGSAAPRRARATTGEAPGPLLLAAPDRLALLAALAADRADAGGGPFRLALFDPTPARRGRARAVVERGEPWRGRDDLWFSPRGLAASGGKVAFLFPGVDASFSPRVDDIAAHFGLPLGLPAEAGGLGDLGYRIIAVNRLLHAALGALGLYPDMIAGHSIGEWSGIIASEMVPPAEIDPLIKSLSGEVVEVPGVVFLAAGCGVEKVAQAIAGLPDIALSHDNCPHQIVVCGCEESARIAQERLTKGGVLCQELPFRSGYHSPLFAEFLGPHRRVLSRLPLAPPKTPLWSATTCAPYPADAEAVRRLAVEHLLRPVRFRELIEALYGEGARVFLQVGTGSLTGFVGDTLRGRPHLAIAGNVPARSGLEQLRRVAAALFVEGAAGAERALDRLGARGGGGDGPRPRAADGAKVALALGVPLVQLHTPLDLPASPLTPPWDGVDATPIADELSAIYAEISSAQREIVSALRSSGARGLRLDPRWAEQQRALSVEALPALLDHAFYRQPPGWPNVADRYPVVPMTMLLSWMMRAAEELVPELVAVGLEDVRALRWLAVAPPVEISIASHFDGEDRVEVTIEGYASATVVLAPAHLAAPAPDRTPLGGQGPARIAAAELYEDRWMFHGPAYQGVVALGAIAPGGIRGTLVSLAAEGGLLDNAGQLLGHWVVEHATQDQLAMPVMIERASFFGPEPPPGEHVECTVRIRHFGPSDVRADVELSHRGALWARIEGWEDIRFDCDERVSLVLRYPERNGIAREREEGYVILRSPWRAAASRDLLGRRYLGERERAALSAVSPRGRDAWLLGRIALKDAARRALWARAPGPIFPIEIEVEDDASGAPRLCGPRAAGLRGAIAHSDDLAAAIVTEGRPVGIALRRVALPGDEREARQEAAREAAAQALGSPGTGLVVVEAQGQRLRVSTEGGGLGTWVQTRLDEGHIVGWTEG